MKEIKTQKGITLVSLTITIIVVLILGAATVETVKNYGIIEYAQNASNQYREAAANEQILLDNYIDVLKEDVSDKEPTVQIKITLTGESTVRVRDTIQLTVVDENQNTISSQDVKWTSSDENVATVKNGIVTGKTSSPSENLTTTITATYIEDNSVIATKQIEVLGRTCDTCDGKKYGWMCDECGGFYIENDLINSGVNESDDWEFTVWSWVAYPCKHVVKEHVGDWEYNEDHVFGIEERCYNCNGSGMLYE